MAWHDRYRNKFVTPTAAAATIDSGQTVHVAPYSTSPLTLCHALKQRAISGRIEDVRIDHPAAALSWTEAELEGRLRLKDNYATPLNRDQCHAGGMDYLPVGIWKSWEIPLGFHQNPDAFLVPVSPPDEHGFCSFGSGVWLSPTIKRKAKRVIAEVHENFIRTGGENFIHVDEIDRFVEAEPQAPAAEIPGPTEEEIRTVEAICTQVAVELINDGDTVQMGVGMVSASLGRFLDFRNDLGVQTELITGGVARPGRARGCHW